MEAYIFFGALSFIIISFKRCRVWKYAVWKYAENDSGQFYSDTFGLFFGGFFINYLGINLLLAFIWPVGLFYVLSLRNYEKDFPIH